MSLRFDYDEAAGVVRCHGRELSLADPEAFELISQAWLRRAGIRNVCMGSLGWEARDSVAGRHDPDQNVYEIQPDVVVETGVALGISDLLRGPLCSNGQGACDRYRC